MPSMNHDRDVDLSDCLQTGDWLIDMMNEPDERSKVYCDLCEREGHAFRSCPARDDDPESF